MKKRYFIIAAIFLFNPIVSIFDILPDFIGYFLLMKAFTDASYVFDNASETHDAMKRMGLISIFKMVCLVILPSTDATMALVFSFTFSILELMYGIGAFQRLFDTTSFICLRCDEDRFVSKSEKLKKFTIGFFIVRILCATIPDLFTLFLSDPSNAWKVRFRTLAFIFTVIIALIVGLVWLVRTTSFFKKTLTKNVNDKIIQAFNEEMKDRQSVFFSKDFIFAIGIIIASMIFAIDVYIDKIEFLSDILIAPIFIVAFAFLIKKRYISVGKHEGFLISLLSIHFVVSILNTVFYTIFIKEHLTTDALRKSYGIFMTEAQRAYLPVRILTGIESLVLLGIITLTLYLFKKYSIERMIENPRFFSEMSIDGYLKEYSAIAHKKCVIAWLGAVAYAISSFVYVCIVPYKVSYVVFNMCIGIFFLLTYYHALSYIRDEIFKKILKYS